MRSKALLPSLVALLGLCPLPLPAQTSANQTGSEADLSERLEVNVVNLDVYVTDGSGRPMTGLTREDFIVRDGGKAVPLSHFEEVSALRVAPGSAQPPATAAPAVPPEPLMLVIYVDNSHSRAGGRQTLVSALRSFVASQLEPQDLVMVSSFTHDVQVLLPFTTDRAALATALDRLEAQPALGNQIDQEWDDALEVAAAVMDDDEATKPHLAEAAARPYTESITHRSLTALEAGTELVTTLGTLPGRKSLIYASDGIDLRPGSALLNALLNAPTLSQGGSASLRSESNDIVFAAKKFTAAANAARVTLYPLDMGGARARASGSAVANEARQSLQDSLSLFAQETGGRALLNAANLGGDLGRVLADREGYYSIAFESPRRGLGEVHLLEVEVKRKGARTRYRQSYRDGAEEDAKRQALFAALWLGEKSNPLEIRIEPAGPAVAGDDGLYLVPIRIGVPLANLYLAEGPTERKGEIEVFVTAVGKDGERSSMARSTVAVRVPAERWERARGQLFGYEIKLRMRPGLQQLAVGVEDRQAATTSVVTHEIRVGATGS
ncbi:MAG TPA: VWA domain-containing protein [Thermoanaerobaculia bacterium]|nr:VWA domain-containing protein [Thermoanaerobaculia bacterium]